MRLLFVTAGRLGDAVLSTGILGHLIETHPGARVTIACGPAPAAIFRAVPGIEAVHVLRKERYAGHWWRLWRELLPLHFDLVVDLRGAPMTRFVRSGRRIAWTRPAETLHKVEELAAVLGVSPPPAPRLWFDAKAESDAARVLQPLAGRPLLALGATVNWLFKAWPPDRFAALAIALTASGTALEGATIAVLGAPGEEELARPLLQALPAERRIDLVGKLDPLAAGALLRHARLFAGPDTGIMHIAAAAGCPTLGLFGPGFPAIYGPWGERTATAVSPMHDHEWPTHQESLMRYSPAMLRLTVEQAISAANRLLERTG